MADGSDFRGEVGAVSVEENPAVSVGDGDNTVGIEDAAAFPATGGTALEEMGIGPGHLRKPGIAKFEDEGQAAGLSQTMSDGGEGKRRGGGED